MEKTPLAPGPSVPPAEKSFSIAAPSLSLPKGGGAIKGIGEKFAANPVTGTGATTVPIATSPGRSGFGPQLSLSYDSGAGNGPFGIGWHLSLPAVTRKSDKGLPRYFDAEESDVFILSGAEDLVPVLVQDQSGNWIREELPIRTMNGFPFRIDRYRPRIDGLFARIERWSNLADRTDVRWRSISKDNLTTWYGIDATSRIIDPADPTRIFSWLICQTHDDKGNVMIYNYASENSQGVTAAQSNERNRADAGRATQRYIRSIRYGNRTAYFPDYNSLPVNAPVPNDADWMFSVVFDYGDGLYKSSSGAGGDPQLIDASFDLNSPISGWPVRQDPFSSYRSCFEVRTYRLCRRTLMFHHFPDALKTPACLVRSTEFSYQEDPVGSFISSVVQSGYLLQAEGVYRKKSLPPLEFAYSTAEINSEVLDVDSASLENLPIGLDGNAYQWVDLDGEGLKGVLAESAGAWYYKRNVSALPQPTNSGQMEVRASFSPVECVARLPATTSVSGHRHQLLDLAGDGNLDLVEFGGPNPGYYKRTPDENWRSFAPFGSLPNIAWEDPNLRFVDLTGDGFADILITEDNVFRYYCSLAEDGFEQADRISQPFDEEMGPRLLVADATVSIATADMSGDGLADLVRVRNGEVCYWPNLGYGRFGAKVTMDNSPWFDLPEQFDPKRLRLADIDGSGTTDLIYLGRNRITIHRNLAGNQFGDLESLDYFPSVDNLAAVQVCDLLGNGTACLVWSSPLSTDAGRPMRYIDLMGGQKPHLLVKTTNNLGAQTEIEYAPSTKFYLADKLAGNPWLSRLAFPVYCVERVTVTDQWRQTSFSSTYSYHHGYFDGVEREFRGFGRVDQVDVESFGEFAAGNVNSPYITPDKTLFQPPVKTVTWHHTGLYLDRTQILSQFQHEYFPNWYEDQHPDAASVLVEFQEKRLPEPDLEALNLTADEWREALRACKGMMLRQEVYELDVDALELGQQVPVKLFSTAYHNCLIRRLQPVASNRYAVFLAVESEALTYHYELDLGAAILRPDPRVSHTLNLRFDDYGNVQQSIAVGYPRLGKFGDDATLAAGLTDALPLIDQVQQELHIAYTETRFTNDLIPTVAADGQWTQADIYRLRMPCELLTYELTGITPENAEVYFSLEELQSYQLSPDEYQPQAAGLTPVTEIPYHAIPSSGDPTKRAVEHTRSLFFADDLSGPLPFRQLGPLGFPYENYKLALTDALLSAIFTDADGDKLAAGIPAGSSARAQLNLANVSGYLSGPDLATRFPGINTAGEYWIRSGIAGFAADAPKNFYLPEIYTDPFGNVTTLTYDSNALLIASSEDALNNITSITSFDYRVLAPREMKDINNNLSQVYFDGLGLPVAVALLGKGTEGDNLTGLDDIFANPTPSDLEAFFTAANYTDTAPRTWLGNATDRHIYYFGETTNSDGSINWGVHPACACGVMRETHLSQLAPGAQSKLQVSLEYSDGLGSVVVKKVQAEPEAPGGPLRWIASGKTVLNNKGKPVKQYEPYFSPAQHRYEEPAEAGVTSVLYYDSAGRTVRTEFPDGSFSQVDFSPWHALHYDQNDTVLESSWYTNKNPLDPTKPLPWDGVTRAYLCTADQRAAWLVAQHANTPALTVVDSLGRDVISVAFNRVEDATGALQDEKYLTFTKLDAEGKPLWIRDARNNLVMQYIIPPVPDGQANDPTTGFSPCYDIAGNLLFQNSMDAGDRWMLNDAAGKPMLAWNFNGQPDDTGAVVRQSRVFFTTYDALHRPVNSFLQTTSPAAAPQTILFGQVIYGDTPGNGLSDSPPSNDQTRLLNLRGKPYLHRDTAGLVGSVAANPITGANEAFDFKGNALRGTRQLTVDYKTFPDWSQSPDLETEIFHQSTRYDALNRPIQTIAHSDNPGTKLNITQPSYNESTKLERVDLWLAQANEPTALLDPAGASQHIVTNIDYDAKGQRLLIAYGNGASTTYTYDQTTFRLTQLYTATTPGAPLQSLNYTYDPVGNITDIRDDAQQTFFFSGQKVEPSNSYEYDALYRLISATGREHIGQNAFPQVDDDDSPRMNQPLPTDSAAMRNYTESYTYDPVGNIMSMQHAAGPSGSWTRAYNYATNSNRLLATSAPGAVAGTFTDKYPYDLHGNMTGMPHLSLMQWDLKDQLQATSRQVVNDGTPETTSYIYDASGQRVRKVTEASAKSGAQARRESERIYLGGFEIYRTYGVDGKTATLERETLHVMDDKRRIALIETRTIGSDTSAAQLIRYQFSNRLGSAALELDDYANVISYEEYHPYGSTSFQMRNQTIKSIAKRYRYIGKERDDENGLNYNVARYYAIWLGRWLNPDPADQPDFNRTSQTLLQSGKSAKIALYGSYHYGANNPIVFKDSNGLKVELGLDFKGNFNALDVVEASVSKETAKNQLNSIKKYLQAVGATQASELHLTGKAYEKFMLTESNALSIKEVQQHFFLQIDRETAVKGRAGQQVSWVFQRLKDIVEKQNSLVQVVSATGLTNSGALGMTGDIEPENPRDLRPASRVVVSTRTTPNPNWQRRSLLQAGRTIVHELVIHAWRDVFFRKDKVPQRLFSSNHEALAHSGRITTKPHNYADIEDHLLDTYEERYSPPINSPDLISHYGISASEMAERKLTPSLIKEVGGIMGSKLFYQKMSSIH